MIFLIKPHLYVRIPIKGIYIHWTPNCSYNLYPALFVQRVRESRRFIHAMDVYSSVEVF